MASETGSADRDDLIRVVSRGHRSLDAPVKLASGDWSRHFIDAKRALARGSDARLAARVMIDLLRRAGVTYEAVGGLTMGADVLAHAVSFEADVEWFSVRKKAKDRGTRQRIEGAVLGPGREVLLVDDVVTRGSSSLDALEAIRETGATVVAALSLVDRGEFGGLAFEGAGVRYLSVLTYADLGIPAVGSEPEVASPTG